jgi:NhaP-type Na+/H+ or K+/H+ antiporter
VAAALILQMTPSEAAQWFGLSFLMHLVYGLMLGIVVSYGLGPAGSHGRAS